MLYTIDDFEIGMEVTWESKNPFQRDFDLPWLVHGISDGQLLINIHAEGGHHHYSIDVSEVRVRIPKANS